MDHNNFENGYSNPYSNATEGQKGTMDPTTGTYSYSRAADPNAQTGNTGYTAGSAGYTGNTAGSTGYTAGSAGYTGNTTGNAGYTGSAGYTAGSAGYTGNTTGNAGYTGSTGYAAGYTGNTTGNAGYTGSTGYTAGSAGYTGNTAGSTGYTAGSTGYTGNTTGNAGYTGSTGYTAGGAGYGQTPPTGPAKQTKKAKKNKEHGVTWGGFLSKAAVAALVFGLVGGGIFSGVSYLGTRNLQTASASSSAASSDSSSDSSTDSVDASATDSQADYTDGTVQTVSTANLEVTDVSDIVDAVMPSIVAITNYGTTTYQTMFGDQTADTESCGSGIIVAQDDDYLYIATNNHVVSGANQLTVQFSDDSVVNASVKGTYEAKDLAVVEVAISDIAADTLNTIKIAEIGDSTQLEVGQSAIAIGNALGYGQSVTTGVISALGRSVTVQEETTGVSITNDNLIQTDAAINPGNSGGALINAQGQVIGINSAKYSDTSVEGFGFSIPMEDAWPVIEQLISKTKVDASESAYLGIKGQDISASVASAYNIPEGVYVYEVVSGSAAESAGLQKGDIITAFDGQTVYSMEGMQELMSYYAAGDTVTLTLSRADSAGNYSETELTVTLGSASGLSH